MGALIALAETGSPDTAAMPWPAWTARKERRLVLSDRVTVEPLERKRLAWHAAHPIPLQSPAPPRSGVRD
jgi:para-nitrobenzyl esterase